MQVLYLIYSYYNIFIFITYIWKIFILPFLPSHSLFFPTFKYIFLPIPIQSSYLQIKQKTLKYTKGYSKHRHHDEAWYPPRRRPVSEQCHWKYLSRPQLNNHSRCKENCILVTLLWCAEKKAILPQKLNNGSVVQCTQLVIWFLWSSLLTWLVNVPILDNKMFIFAWRWRKLVA